MSSYAFAREMLRYSAASSTRKTVFTIVISASIEYLHHFQEYCKLAQRLCR